MKPVTWIAIVLIVLGIVAFSYQGVIWVSGKETVAKVGPFEIEREKEYPVPLAPVLGGVAIAAGVILLATRGRSAA